MTNKEKLKQELNKYTKEQIIDALLNSAAATGFVIVKLKDTVKDPVKNGGKKND